ncbi:TfoX/Sxy family DNA transformation protein [Kosakonia sp. ML.JS2a]|uniref:TfoX/Sxy family DNA transformation protein n=1 Tax=Kosakonia sp. ML.JS2a TaxID=2980557 RepID=UPI0021D8F8F2|nr:TfoX/Sxy family DNA transformation protein [Kosakonia sp. ML.JS2a]UXY09359.1 TfoX/Sxy family DNA transformation protein [Kosakonia sp. ML.JS2a]
MEDISHQRIYQSCECLASLGDICYRAHFGGYSLSVDKTVFAMVAGGELYLRACDESAHYTVTRQAPMLMFNKRGRQVSLNYYFVNERLWSDRALLLELSALSLSAAKQEKIQRTARLRLRDLPNLTFQLEALLHDAGVLDAHTLRLLGAKACWLRLRKMNQQLSVKVLFALEGAIIGLHEAALPAIRRQELLEWFNELITKGSKPY